VAEVGRRRQPKTREGSPEFAGGRHRLGERPPESIEAPDSAFASPRECSTIARLGAISFPARLAFGGELRDNDGRVVILLPGRTP
jgi:hypothetical protein